MVPRKTRTITSAVVRNLALAFVFSLALASGAAGQETPTGTISGYILDPHGLAVPRSTKVLVDSATGGRRVVFSNEHNSYNLTTKASGFEAIRQNGLLIEVDQKACLDFTLTLGSKTDTITVLGSAPLLDTSDASVSTLISNRFVENMPLNGAELQLPDRSGAGGLTPTTLYDQGQFSVNGQRPDPITS